MIYSHKLVEYPLTEEVLYKKSAKIDEITDEIVQLAHNLAQIMYDSGGIGIAAPQVGIYLNLIVIDCSEEKNNTVYLLNPEIEWQTPTTSHGKEGCLSYPGLVMPITRPKKIKVVAMSLEGEKIEFEASGIYARCICHEIDHLNGIPFTRRVSRQVRRHLMRKWERKRDDI